MFRWHRVPSRGPPLLYRRLERGEGSRGRLGAAGSVRASDPGHVDDRCVEARHDGAGCGGALLLLLLRGEGPRMLQQGRRSRWECMSASTPQTQTPTSAAAASSAARAAAAACWAAPSRSATSSDLRADRTSSSLSACAAAAEAACRASARAAWCSAAWASRAAKGTESKEACARDTGTQGSWREGCGRVHRTHLGSGSSGRGGAGARVARCNKRHSHRLFDRGRLVGPLLLVSCFECVRALLPLVRNLSVLSCDRAEGQNHKSRYQCGYDARTHLLRGQR